MPSAPTFFALVSFARLFGVVVALCACSDATAAPGTLDPDAVGLVIPAVHDARVRITRGIIDVRVASALRRDILALERALLAGDAVAVTLRADDVSMITVEYAEQSGPGTEDGAELSAIQLMLIAVRWVLEGGV